jgi:hypothetical protein
VVGQSSSDLVPAVGTSIVLDGGWIAMARWGWTRPSPRLLPGVAAGVPIVHSTLWPLKVIGDPPLLTEVEGPPSPLMPVYNAIPYAWAGAGAPAILLDTTRGHRRWFLGGLLGVTAIRPAARRHLAWTAEEATGTPSGGTGRGCDSEPGHWRIERVHRQRSALDTELLVGYCCHGGPSDSNAEVVHSANPTATPSWPR